MRRKRRPDADVFSKVFSRGKDKDKDREKEKEKENGKEKDALKEPASPTTATNKQGKRSSIHSLLEGKFEVVSPMVSPLYKSSKSAGNRWPRTKTPRTPTETETETETETARRRRRRRTQRARRYSVPSRVQRASRRGAQVQAARSRYQSSAWTRICAKSRRVEGLISWWTVKWTLTTLRFKRGGGVEAYACVLVGYHFSRCVRMYSYCYCVWSLN